MTPRASIAYACSCSLLSPSTSPEQAGILCPSMQFPKLTPLQSRIVVSLAASLIVIVFYLSLSSPHFAYAVETDSIAPKDPNRPPLLGLQDRLGFTERYSWDDDEVEQNYEPEFAELERGISELAPKSQNLNNNTPGKRSIQVGDGPHYWVFQNETLWGTQAPGIKRLRSPLVDITDWGTFQNSTEQQNSPEGTRGVYVSLSVCDQPSSTSGTPNDAPPQLELYISFSNPEPGPGNSNYSVPVDAGFGSSTLNASAAIYFAVLAPPSSNFNGKYSYELAVSIDAPYASYVDTTFLNVLDSDTNATLLETNVTANVTGPLNNTEYQQWMDGTPPFSLFALKNDSAIWGIHKSFCGLKNHAQIKGDPTDQQPSSVNMSMTDRAGGRPKEQFYIQNLNGSSAYLAIPAIDGTSNQSGGGAVGGGGLLWAPTSFRTKSGTYSKLISDFIQTTHPHLRLQLSGYFQPTLLLRGRLCGPVQPASGLCRSREMVRWRGPTPLCQLQQFPSANPLQRHLLRAVFPC